MAAERLITDGGARARVGDEPREVRFDVLVDGQPVRRAVPVRVDRGAVCMGEDELALDSVFWVSRRAGLVLLFARDRTLALLGRSADLEVLARAVERGSDRAAQRSLLQPLAREVVVCTAGTAVSGAIGDARVSGLHLAVFTQRGLHLFAGAHRHSLAWPVDRVAEISTAPGEAGRAGLKLTKEGHSVTLRYLFPEEIQAVARVARRSPSPPAEPDPTLELFAKGEVAPPPPPALPQFTISAETLQRAGREAAARIRVDPSLAERFDAAYFERHFQELGEIALGPLMLRRSAAQGAESLPRAVEALDADQLRQDAIAALQGAADQLVEVYGGEVETILFAKRLDREEGSAARAAGDRARLAADWSKRVGVLDPVFGRVLARQHLLLQRLHARDHAPPETADTGVEEATEEWKAEIAKLDRAYGDAWGAVLGDIADVWSGEFLPRLKELAARPRRRLSEGARLAILATLTFVLVGALAMWLF